jgi:hypothetical protein
MIRIFLVLLIIQNFLYSADSAFITQQKLLLNVKTIIQEEESMARAYERFIINERKLPILFSELKNNNYLGSGFSLTSFDSTALIESDFDFNLKKNINNRLKGTTLVNDTSIKHLYESDLFRKKTYYVDTDTIGIKLEDMFANHLYFLSSTGGFNLIECNTIPKKKYCTKGDDIYIYKEDSQLNFLMYYSIDKFKTGPIIITSDTSLHITNDEFNYIPKSALLYDTEAVKYIKTRTSIEVVK